MTAAAIKKALRSLADSKRAETSKGYFKTAKGESAEGDQFLGVKVPDQRRVAREFRGTSLSEIVKLLESKVHEDRLTAVFLMVDAYQRAKKDVSAREEVVTSYLAHVEKMSGWDIVDSGAPKILGDWLLTHDRSVLYDLIKSKNIWSRRAALVATQTLISQGEITEVFELSEQVLGDKEDLIHKAAGWMLKEAGEKVSVSALSSFLKKHAAKMPRTMLRYSIEKLPAAERKKWLAVTSSAPVSARRGALERHDAN